MNYIGNTEITVTAMSLGIVIQAKKLKGEYLEKFTDALDAAVSVGRSATAHCREVIDKVVYLCVCVGMEV